MTENIKKVEEVFSDFETESVIKTAGIKSLNVCKKDNSLGIVLESPEFIEIKDIWGLEKFLKGRFQFSNISTKIEYDKDTKIKPIDSEWENVVCYISHKSPMTKDMLFRKSDIEVVNDTINVKMHIPGLQILKAR